MSRFRFDLANEADDASLRRVLAATPMEGSIAVSFRREPSWFAAAAIDGFDSQIVACRETDTGAIVGFGCRSIRRLHVDRVPQDIGYLSSLRLLEAYRNRGLVARGYAFFRRLHADGRVPYYLTTIAAGNLPALKTLTSGRAGLPAYTPVGDYHTLAIPLTPSRRFDSPIDVRRAQAGDLPAIRAFLREHGPRRQFFPLIDDDFGTGQGTFLGLQAGELLVARQQHEITGVVGLWDQYAYKQSLVVGYRGPLRWLRPAANAWSALRGRPTLPAPGEAFRFCVAAALVVREDAHDVLEALLCHAAGQSTSGSHLLVGLHERDPLLADVRRWSTACYTTRLYVVSWDGASGVQAATGQRVPYLELGTL